MHEPLIPARDPVAGSVSCYRQIIDDICWI